MRKWRVGTISMGILLIATGLVLLMSELQGFNGASMILRWWPAILIILGGEILAYIVFSREEQPKIKFDGLSIFLTIFIILVSAGVYGVGTFVKSDFSQVVFGEMGYFKNESIVNKKFDIDAGQVKKLQINNSMGFIEVDKYEGDKILVDVSITIKNNDEEAALKLAENLIEIREGETLTLNTRNANNDDNRSYKIATNYVVKIPKSMDLDVKSKFGDISIQDLMGNVKIDGEFGKVEVDNIKGDVEIDNSFGETRVQDITGKVEIENKQGEIFYSNRQTALNDIILDSKMGGITLELPSNQQGAFDVATKLGKISMGGFDTELSINKDVNNQNMRGTIGKSTPIISLSADHGGINITGR